MRNVLVAIVVGLASVTVWAQTETIARFAKVFIRSTASDALVNSGGTDLSGYFVIRNNDPVIDLRESDAATDEKYWGFISASGDFIFREINDAYSSTTDVFRVGRTGATPGPFTFSVPVAVGASATPIASILSGTVTWDPALLQVDGGYDSTFVTVTGVTSGSPCVASFTATLSVDIVLSARYETTNTVRAILMNPNTGGTYDPGSGTVRVTCFVY